jgi:DNA-binding XRE family transcriptional regulator
MTARQFKAARKSLGVTQQHLALSLDVHRVTIARWETGAEPIPRAIELAIEALQARARRRQTRRR